ncbi:MAG: tyrosine-type recombinase/integrase [Chloroflexota bacterium]
MSHIDSERHLLHVCHGKGGKDRYVPLPPSILVMLRRYWLTHRDPVWLFPSPFRPEKNSMNASGVQRAFYAALRDSGIHKPATVHTLRHSYATLLQHVSSQELYMLLGILSPFRLALFGLLIVQSVQHNLQGIAFVLSQRPNPQPDFVSQKA